ncbi:hypothetical protein IQ250_26145 [Pseudanabaenaceae cyanobacterium LEGE 13415]|nr:hypothetical protein [Pseudanabaenaceae cyanobacterium LEGE 13415]
MSSEVIKNKKSHVLIGITTIATVAIGAIGYTLYDRSTPKPIHTVLSKMCENPSMENRSAVFDEIRKYKKVATMHEGYVDQSYWTNMVDFVGCDRIGVVGDVELKAHNTYLLP